MTDNPTTEAGCTDLVASAGNLPPRVAWVLLAIGVFALGAGIVTMAVQTAITDVPFLSTIAGLFICMWAVLDMEDRAKKYGD